MKHGVRYGTLLRLFVIGVWISLFGALLFRDVFVKSVDLREIQALQQGREESYQGIFFKKERIGYVRNRFVPAGNNTIRMEQDALLHLNILDQVHPVRMRVEASLTEGLLLQSFRFELSSPFYRMIAKGHVQGRDVRFSLTTGKETIEDVVHLKSPPYLSTNQRGYLLKQGLDVGEKIRIPYFDPVSLSGKDTMMEYKGLVKILISGRIQKLHHFVENFSGIRINSWLDEEGNVVKEESPAGFVFIREPEFKAKDIVAKGREILSSVSVPLTGKMPDLSQVKSIRYRLTLPTDGDFVLNKDRQTFENGLLTITKENLPGSDASPCEGPAEALASTPYIQVATVAIVNRARSLVKVAPDAVAKVAALADWVYENIEKRPVLGIPDAVTTLQTRTGDCNEHAALFAALARSVQVPTRVVAGVTFHQGAFFYHAWNEVCLDDTWISLDTTKNQFPADITHIKFVEGETSEQVKIGALLGKLKIEVVGAGAGD